MTRDEIAARLLELGSAMMHEATGRRGSIGPDVRPLWSGAVLAGPCRTVQIAAGDNLGAHIALEAAEPGDVLCVASAGSQRFGFWGEVVTTYAMAKGVAGLVTTLGVRDIQAVEAVGFPVFAACHAIQGTVKRQPGRHQVPIRLGQAIVRPGDWIVGDADGCMVIRAQDVETGIARAEAKVTGETVAKDRIRAGETSRKALNLP